MIRYDVNEFRTWLLNQGSIGREIMNLYPLHELHTICLNFKDEIDAEQSALEHELYLRSLQNTLAEIRRADEAREAAAHRNAVDAVLAEQSAAEAGPENLRHGIESDV